MKMGIQCCCKTAMDLCPCCGDLDEFEQGLMDGMCLLKATITVTNCSTVADTVVPVFCDRFVKEVALIYTGPDREGEELGFCFDGCEWRRNPGLLDVRPCESTPPEYIVWENDWFEGCSNPEYDGCDGTVGGGVGESNIYSCFAWQHNDESIALACTAGGWKLYFNPYGCFSMASNGDTPVGCDKPSDSVKNDTIAFDPYFQTCDIDNFFLEFHIPVINCEFPFYSGCVADNDCEEFASEELADLCCQGEWIITIEKLSDSPFTCDDPLIEE